MVEEADGGGAWRQVPTQCMNWHVYGLREIWHMLEPEDGRISRNQVQAWGLMRSLCEYQAHRLRDAWSSLADVWPPDGSRAATEFRGVVLAMARSLDESAAAAHENAKALSALTDGIADTRGKIADLVAEYNTIEAKRRHPKVSAAAATELDRQKAEIVEAARRTMRDADVIPATATEDFRIPPKYHGIDDREDNRAGSGTLAAGTLGPLQSARRPSPHSRLQPPAPSRVRHGVAWCAPMRTTRELRLGRTTLRRRARRRHRLGPTSIRSRRALGDMAEALSMARIADQRFWHCRRSWRCHRSGRLSLDRRLAPELRLLQASRDGQRTTAASDDADGASDRCGGRRPTRARVRRESGVETPTRSAVG